MSIYSFRGRAITGLSALLFASALGAHAGADTASAVDGLTRQWLDTERQASALQTDWQAQQPILQQRIALLTAEKEQLRGLLKESSASRNDVETRRAELLAEQAQLESQQQQLSQALERLVAQIDGMSKLLPPPLQATWAKERSALGEEPDASLRLQVALAQLSSLAEFDQRVAVHEISITTKEGKELLVKQLYLGVGMAWFTSADGRLAGWGQASDDGWQWHFDAGDINVSDINVTNIKASEISQAIAIFEKREQANFVRLPVHLSGAGSAQNGMEVQP